MKTGWWYRATTEQRLAQIDAAIELGMTAKQTAMNCGCVYDGHRTWANREGHLVDVFAANHGRRFNGRSAGAHLLNIETNKVDARRRFDNVDHRLDDFAYDIFGTHSAPDPLNDVFGGVE